MQKKVSIKVQSSNCSKLSVFILFSLYRITMMGYSFCSHLSHWGPAHLRFEPSFVCHEQPIEQSLFCVKRNVKFTQSSDKSWVFIHKHRIPCSVFLSSTSSCGNTKRDISHSLRVILPAHVPPLCVSGAFLFYFVGLCLLSVSCLVLITFSCSLHLLSVTFLYNLRFVYYFMLSATIKARLNCLPLSPAFGSFSVTFGLFLSYNLSNQVMKQH